MKTYKGKSIENGSPKLGFWKHLLSLNSLQFAKTGICAMVMMATLSLTVKAHGGGGGNFKPVGELGDALQLITSVNEDGCLELGFYLAEDSVVGVDFYLTFSTAFPDGATFTAGNGGWFGGMCDTEGNFTLLGSNVLHIEWGLPAGSVASGDGLFFTIIICGVSDEFLNRTEVRVTEGGVMIVDIEPGFAPQEGSESEGFFAKVVGADDPIVSLSVPTALVGNCKALATSLNVATVQLATEVDAEYLKVDCGSLTKGWWILRLLNEQGTPVGKAIKLWVEGR